ncbi:MAG: TRAP transporter large permease subunit [Epsilonproteobacteria bacterium]|nr:TRAP transporter large permease subunit [Campylobacterota bacterium]
MTGLIMFIVALFMLLIGFPVAFTFGAVALIFGAISSYFELAQDGAVLFADWADEFISMFSMMPFRIYSIMQNKILIAIPLFIFMGIVLEKSSIAKRLLESMGTLFGRVRGGLAVSTVIIGTMLAASTGVVGASVVAMGVIALPVMLKHGYDKGLASGTICASGTLGQIIPPSIVLIILADVFNQPVGDLFKAAIMPSMLLVGAYIAYILVVANLKRDIAPAMHDVNLDVKGIVYSLFPPLILIILVLGSIFAGIATATESASVGAVGSVILAGFYKQLNIKLIEEAALEAVKITSMVFAILIGATAFSMVFVYSGADSIVEDFLTALPHAKLLFVVLVMLIIFFLGFFIDFIEISYIVVPILLPVADSLGIDPIWFAILIALNLQSSFLTPPFGFSLFYLRGVAPKEVTTLDIYKGVIPFILIQLCILAFMVAWGFRG